MHGEPAPANPDASPKARAVLHYLHSLSARTTNRVLLGQFLGYPNRSEIPGNSFSLAPAEEVFRRTGKWPALVGADYSGRTVLDYTNHRDLSYETVNPVLKTYAQAGGLVTISVHFLCPFPPHGLRDDGADLRKLLEPGAPRDYWLKQLDYVAAGLADLQASGVVVLFRPLHEHTSGGHWWTKGRATSSGDYDQVFKQVWIDLFHYYTETKHLNNLLWVWNPKRNYIGTYPGDQYVDIVGPDQYDGDFRDTYEANFGHEFAAVMATGKIFGVQETGPGPKLAATYDARKLIDVIKAQAPKTAFILVWHDPQYRLSNMQHLQELVDDPWIVTRDEVEAK
jgi:mannan endo-1,4-beta-mannosidase